jgi:hypothetical protein
MDDAERDAAATKLRRGERFALGRCFFWIANMPAAWLLLPGDPAVKYLIEVSLYANAESAYSSYSAKRGERRSLENP